MNSDITQLCPVCHETLMWYCTPNKWFHIVAWDCLFLVGLHFFDSKSSSFLHVQSFFIKLHCMCETAAVFRPQANTWDHVADQHHLAIRQFLHPDAPSYFVFSNFWFFNWDIWCLIWRGCSGSQGLQLNWYESHAKREKYVSVIAQSLKWISNNPVSCPRYLIHLLDKLTISVQVSWCSL